MRCAKSRLVEDADESAPVRLRKPHLHGPDKFFYEWLDVSGQAESRFRCNRNPRNGTGGIETEFSKNSKFGFNHKGFAPTVNIFGLFLTALVPLCQGETLAMGVAGGLTN